MNRAADSESAGCRAVGPKPVGCRTADCGAVCPEADGPNAAGSKAADSKAAGSNELVLPHHSTAYEGALSLYANENAAGGLSVALPFASPVKIFERVPVVGTLNDRCTADANCRIEVGCDLKLKCQRNNLLDRWAVEVLFQTERLGWVSADSNEVVFRLLDGGKTLGASVTDEEYTPQGIRYLIDITLED